MRLWTGNTHKIPFVHQKTSWVFCLFVCLFDHLEQVEFEHEFIVPLDVTKAYMQPLKSIRIYLIFRPEGHEEHLPPLLQCL